MQRNVPSRKEGETNFREHPKASFTYNNKVYTGTIFSSTKVLPHYHWFYFDDEEIINMIGDSLGFKAVNGWLEPVTFYDSRAELIHAVHTAVAAHLAEHA
ncbi:MAG: hypothetical protein K0Q66_1415 [Chitinophagaceae bacterium]|jgi:hypothetical protein|nr:hypothetical protein [Chitinophagaceae bacterium]